MASKSQSKSFTYSLLIITLADKKRALTTRTNKLSFDDKNKETAFNLLAAFLLFFLLLPQFSHGYMSGQYV